MNKKSDILILTTSFGMGHNSVAKAISGQLVNENPNLEVNIIDLLDVSNPNSKDLFFNVYKLLTKNHPTIYNHFYKLKKDVENNYLDEIMYNIYLKKVAKFIMESEAKLIISTFPLCSGFVSRAKEKYNLDVPLITSITDVVDSWEWIHNNTDMYFVPCKVVESKLMEKGIPNDKIKITGIPVQDEFLNTNKKNKDYKQVLIMGGAMDKIGLSVDVLKALDGVSKLKTVVITGNNKELYERLNKAGKLNNVEILGYTTEIAKLMDDSDVLVTKPGGATLFEAINKGIPMVLKNSNVGQEEENIQFIRDTGIGILLDEDECLEDALIKSLSDDIKMDQIKHNIEEVRLEIQPEKVGQYVLELL